MARNNSIIAVVTSLLFPGLGHIYLGKNKKGIVLVIAGFLALILTFVLIGFILFPIIWMYGIFDAFKTSNKGKFIELNDN